jgi:hypothetical protein
VERRLRAIYLQDHLAAATAGHELAKRAASSNEGTPLGGFLSTLKAEISEDRAALLQAMEELGVGADRLKSSVAWGAEKVGRLKPNGRLLTYSPLSRLVELEGLHLAIAANVSMWQVLEATSAKELSLDLGELVGRARRQLSELEPFRLAAAADAFAESAESA